MARKTVMVDDGTDDVRSTRPDIETWVASWQVEYKFHEDINAGSFDIEKSLRNQARLGAPIDDDLVSRYAAAMSSGDTFPPVVAWRDKNGKLVVVDGNHRVMAAREADRNLSVYVVQDVKAQTITAMTFEANVRHGKGTSDEERVHHALWLKDNGMSTAEAARRMGVKPTRLTKAAAEQEGNRRADTVGINRKDWDGLPASTRVRLANVYTDEGFRDATKLAVSAQLGTADVFELVAALNDTRSGQRQVAMIKNRRNELADRIQDVKSGKVAAIGYRGRSPKARLASSLGLFNALPEPVVLTDSLTEVERDEYAVKIDAAIDNLTILRKALAAR